MTDHMKVERVQLALTLGSFFNVVPIPNTFTDRESACANGFVQGPVGESI